MRATIIMLTLCFALVVRAVVPPFTSVTAAWDRAQSHGTNISFVLKWGDSTNNFQFSTNVGQRTSIALTNPTPGYLYFIVVARTPDGLESEPSNLLVVTNYPAAPLRLRIETNTTSSVIIEGIMDGITDWKQLAVVTSDPVEILGARKGMMLRAKVPPIPELPK